MKQIMTVNTRKDSERESDFINIEILRGGVKSLGVGGKKAAHCCGKRRT